MTDSINLMKERISKGELQPALEESRNGRKNRGEGHREVHRGARLLRIARQAGAELGKVLRGRPGGEEPAQGGQEAGERGDWSMMGILSCKGREDITKTLPDVLKSEMRRAKSTLLDSKANGKELRSWSDTQGRGHGHEAGEVRGGFGSAHRVQGRDEARRDQSSFFYCRSWTTLISRSNTARSWTLRELGSTESRNTAERSETLSTRLRMKRTAPSTGANQVLQVVHQYHAHSCRG